MLKKKIRQNWTFEPNSEEFIDDETADDSGIIAGDGQ